MNCQPRILVAGIGNIFLGDDAFGSEVAREMMKLNFPEGVMVADFGIRSYDLAYALTDRIDTAILVDAVSRGGSPGTIYLLEPTVSGIDPAEGTASDPHGLDVSGVLQMVRSHGDGGCKIYLVGCEPVSLESDDGQLGLSEPVRAAVPQAITMIKSLITGLLCAEPSLNQIQK
jgi:hydrogenase maturation protease